MKKEISLNQFLLMGGDINKLDLNQTTITYSGLGHARNKKIISITEDGMNKFKTAILYECKFEDGTSHYYAGTWIETEVSLVLDSQYI